MIVQEVVSTAGARTTCRFVGDAKYCRNDLVNNMGRILSLAFGTTRRMSHEYSLEECSGVLRKVLYVVRVRMVLCSRLQETQVSVRVLVRYHEAQWTTLP